MDNLMTQDLIKRAANDLAVSSHAIVLTGAGISTESGVPDFRGPKGIWTTNPAGRGPGLPEVREIPE